LRAVVGTTCVALLPCQAAVGSFFLSIISLMCSFWGQLARDLNLRYLAVVEVSNQVYSYIYFHFFGTLPLNGINDHAPAISLLDISLASYSFLLSVIANIQLPFLLFTSWSLGIPIWLMHHAIVFSS